jgi:hypothetical protein
MGINAGAMSATASSGGGAGGFGMASIGAQGISSVTSAISAYYSAKSQQSSLNYQADIEAINAQQTEFAAQQALLNGNTAAAQISQRAGQVKSGQRAAIAANGIGLDSANASEALTSTDIAKEQDVNTAVANAVRAAWGYRTQETNQQNDALMKRAGANSISPFAAFSTSLLGGAGQVASSWYQFNKAGVGQVDPGTANILKTGVF